MARLRVNTIVNRNDNGVVTLGYGASIPSTGSITAFGNATISGVATVGLLTAKNANISGIITATTFIGDGSQLQGVPTVSSAKSIALKIIMDPLPFRA